MGHNGSSIPRNGSEPLNTSGAVAVGANRTAPGELGEAQLYRQFTTTVQVVIFVGSLLGKPPRGVRGMGAGGPGSCRGVERGRPTAAAQLEAEFSYSSPGPRRVRCPSEVNLPRQSLLHV